MFVDNPLEYISECIHCADIEEHPDRWMQQECICIFI